MHSFGMPVDFERAERLVTARKALGLERPEVAAALGIPYSTYGNYEDGQRGFRDPTARRIATFLKVNFDWLQTGRGPMKGRQDPLARLNPEGQKKALDHIEMLERLYPAEKSDR
jgi:transcriptional regulator with XRE-family HTH domain